MQNENSQTAVVGAQFGSQAQAYVTSAVHSQGPDLEAMATLLGSARDARVLDLGCGGGHVSFMAAPRVREVVAYDLSAEMLEAVAGAARERGLANIRTRQGVAESLPFADASFDAVLSRYTVHHWADFPGGLREAARVLKPGGRTIFVDAIAPGDPATDTFFQGIELLRDRSHVRDYSRAEWESAIAQAGLIPGTVQQFRVRLEFAAWVARMRTPELNVQAIRALQASVPAKIVQYFDTAEDGSFSIDVALFAAAKPI